MIGRSRQQKLWNSGDSLLPKTFWVCFVAVTPLSISSAVPNLSHQGTSEPHLWSLQPLPPRSIPGGMVVRPSGLSTKENPEKHYKRWNIRRPEGKETNTTYAGESRAPTSRPSARHQLRPGWSTPPVACHFQQMLAGLKRSPLKTHLLKKRVWSEARIFFFFSR